MPFSIARVSKPPSRCNNAGITGGIGQLANLNLETLGQTLDVNVVGTVLLSQRVVRYWQGKSIPGRIVNISSVATTLGAPREYVHYAASKAAVDAFTIGLGKEVAASDRRIGALSRLCRWRLKAHSERQALRLIDHIF